MGQRPGHISEGGRAEAADLSVRTGELSFFLDNFTLDCPVFPSLPAHVIVRWFPVICLICAVRWGSAGGLKVTSGIMRLVPSPKNYGLRFHCARYLNDLIAASGVYIPVAPGLIEALSCREVLKADDRPKGRGRHRNEQQKKGVRGASLAEKKKKKRRHRDRTAESVPLSATKPVEWRTTLRVPESALKAAPFHEGVVTQVRLWLTAERSLCSLRTAVLLLWFMALFEPFLFVCRFSRFICLRCT